MAEEQDQDHGLDEQELIAHGTTYEAMVGVMRDLGVIAKSRQSEAGGKYQYRGIEELLAALGPACRRHGLMVVMRAVGEPVMDEYLAGANKSTVMHWVKVRVEVDFIGAPGDVVTGAAWGEAADSGDKAMSKAMSIAYREVCFKSFVVPTFGEDYDTEAGGDRSAASRSSRAGSASSGAADAGTNDKLAADLASAKDRGWEDLDELEKAWADVKAMMVGDSESAKWARGWASATGMKMGTITATMVHEMEATMAMAKQDGGWRKDFTPPEPPVKGGK